MRNQMRSKYSFLTVLAAITTITVNQLHGVFLSFRGNIEGLTELAPLPHLSHDPSLRDASNRSSTGAGAAEPAMAVQQEFRSTTFASSNTTIDGLPSDAMTTILTGGNAIPNVSIVCEMSGELGNHLGHIAHCVGIALWLERQHNVSSHLVMRLRRTWNIGRWAAAQKEIRSCFPKLSAYHFNEANNDAFPIRRQQQTKLKLKVSDVNSRNALRFAVALLTVVNYMTRHPLQEGNSSVSLPFIYSTFISSDDFLVDRYVDDMRNLFVLDQAKAECCSQIPDPDETVFHFRNFAKELPGRANAMGFQELGPKQTAQELFGHLKEGDKVAIISRFKLEHAKHYVKALKDRGLKVRFILNQTGIQDFCFLMHTQKEMVGTSVSTYFKWAALLSNASSVVAYSLDVPAQKRRVAHLRHYPFTNPQLSKSWSFRKFTPKE